MKKKELREWMQKLPEPVTDKTPPHWEYWRHELWKHIAGGDDPDEFMSWPCVSQTMLVNHWKGAVDREFSELGVGWMKALFAPTQFSPADCYDNSCYSRNLIHQAYHLQQWEEATGQRVADLKSITEFGGGYGAMALVALRMGFKGIYFIHDLPEFELLQRYFIGCFKPVTKGHVRWIGMPDRKRYTDLLIGCYSLSEAPIETRDRFLMRVSPASCLFLYSGQWEDYDNVTYFQNQHFLSNWKHWELTHIPDKNNWYSIGWR